MNQITSRIINTLIMIVLSIMLIVFCSGMDNRLASTVKKPEKTESKTGNSTSDELPKNPIDFKLLQEENEDIYAWINIPNTNVDYPIAQSSENEEEDFYLHKDTKKNYSFAGTIYTQKLNKKDFSDPVTVVYGHSMLNKTMFGSLHSFRDESFFNENQLIYIYTKDRILTYRIFATYVYDDRLILYSFDNFEDEEVYRQYLDQAMDPSMYGGNHRNLEITTKDKVLILSTCLTADGPNRLLVHAVLEKEEKTQ